MLVNADFINIFDTATGHQKMTLGPDGPKTARLCVAVGVDPIMVQVGSTRTVPHRRGGLTH